MPIESARLQQCLTDMKADYLADPTAAVRSQSFINHLHQFCIDELRRHGVDESRVTIMPEATVYGAHKEKDVDVAVIHEINGPQIMIGIRSQMSSVGKNLLTYYESIIGDVISLHDRFPMAVIGYVYLLPKAPIKPGLHEVVDLGRAATLFKMITGRQDWHSPGDKYEQFAFLPVDFDQDPPQLLTQFSQGELDFSEFFDSMLKTYRQRNYFASIV